MESLIRMNNYIKDFHYEFKTKHITLNYRVAEYNGGTYLPITFFIDDIMPVLKFLTKKDCIFNYDFDGSRCDDVIIDVYFKYDTPDTSINKICTEAIQMIKEIADNKKEEC